MNIGLLRGGSTPLCAVIQMSSAPQTDSRRRGREGRLYLVGAVAVDGQATAGRMSIAIETLLEPRRGPESGACQDRLLSCELTNVTAVTIVHVE